MLKLRPNIKEGESAHPYVIPVDHKGEPLEVSAVQSVTWSLFETDGTAIETEDVAITSQDSEGRWVANITPAYTTLSGNANKDVVVVFTVIYSATIGGVAYSNLVIKEQGQITIEHVTGA
jgi:hypothetical protein